MKFKYKDKVQVEDEFYGRKVGIVIGERFMLSQGYDVKLKGIKEVQFYNEDELVRI